ncbi:MAG: hypothetical protein CM15mP117_18940 [Alphaproteobacteria bacterium]|nr:MAG: hypothetical protein CM15mP117_18940 [Alphaproteobacteria bacterium]
MVAINPFNYEQVAIIFIFLSILIGVLFFVRKNKFILKTKLQNEKSISVIEDVAINQTERLRLVKVGDETFLMSSGKGVSAQLIKLDPENTASKISKLQNLENKNSIQPVKSQLNANKKENQKTINLTEKIGESKLINTKSIFDAIKQARSKNPLLGLDK